MFGCDSRPAVRPSRRKRSRTTASDARCGGSVLIATRRSSFEIAREIDHAHAAAADFPLELILSGERSSEARLRIGEVGRECGCHKIYNIAWRRLAEPLRSC